MSCSRPCCPDCSLGPLRCPTGAPAKWLGCDGIGIPCLSGVGLASFELPMFVALRTGNAQTGLR